MGGVGTPGAGRRYGGANERDLNDLAKKALSYTVSACHDSLRIACRSLNPPHP